MSITMSSNNYEIEQDSMEAEYGDDILYIGWNPEVDSVRQQLQLEPATKQPAMSAEPTTEVAELFLRKMYSFQC